MGATQTYLFGLIKMNRRYISELPMSRLAIWSRHMAWFALATTVIAIFIVRSDFLEERFGLPTLGGALAFAVVAVLFAFAAFVVIWRDGLSGIGAALTGIFVSLALLEDQSERLDDNTLIETARHNGTTMQDAGEQLCKAYVKTGGGLLESPNS